MMGVGLRRMSFPARQALLQILRRQGTPLPQTPFEAPHIFRDEKAMRAKNALSEKTPAAWVLWEQSSIVSRSARHRGKSKHFHFSFQLVRLIGLRRSRAHQQLIN
jgi:hypothetical protein